MKRSKKGILTANTIWEAFKDSFMKLTPQVQFRNPVMFVTYVGAILATLFLFIGWHHKANPAFDIQISLWLWFTVLFANFAGSIAESRGKAQAESLKRVHTENFARKLFGKTEKRVSATELECGDFVVCEAGDMIPADGEVVEGIATVDESAITGESTSVIRESGGDRSAVTGGTRVVNDRIMIRITSHKGQTFLDRMISLIEGAKRQKTPNEIALNIVLSALTIIFILTTLSLKFFADYSAAAARQDLSHIVTCTVLIALLVCLIPTTISALLSAVGIAGMDRLVQKNVLAKSGRAVEAAGDIDLLILDKTGTITIGNRTASEFIPVKGLSEKSFAEMAHDASLSDETPEGRSIVFLAKAKFGFSSSTDQMQSVFIPFSAQTKMSGVNFMNDQQQVVRMIQKGAVEAIQAYVVKLGGTYPDYLDDAIVSIANNGGTPLLVAEGNKVVGLIHLKDIIKAGIKGRFAELRKAGIRTLMMTGDNPLTAGAIAAEAGVDDFVAQALPEAKLQRIRDEQKKGHLVAMTGDGTNDAPALAQADVGVAMNTGTQACRDAGDMVDLDSDPTKLLDIVEIGKQLLITRGALTTFSIANDVAKYFAIIPAIFGSLYAQTGEPGPLNYLNIMNLNSPQSAILSAVIFNALIIIALIPLSLKGVTYHPKPTEQLLRRHLFIYGLGGFVAPFIGIKLLDLVINKLGVLHVL